VKYLIDMTVASSDAKWIMQRVPSHTSSSESVIVAQNQLAQPSIFRFCIHVPGGALMIPEWLDVSTQLADKSIDFQNCSAWP
jgi:hypothetical protein